MELLNSLKQTNKANRLFTEWFNGDNGLTIKAPLKAFMHADIMFQKGVFEMFFATHNLGLFVRDRGYDIYILNPSKYSNRDKNALFLYEAIITDELGVDYYIKHHWPENTELNFKHFTFEAIVETMKYINV